MFLAKNPVRYLIITLIMGLLALAWLSRSPFCINSGLIERIDRWGLDSSTQVYSCQKNIDVEYDDELRLFVEKIEPELQKIEFFINSLRVPIKILNITWIDSENKLVKLQYSNLIYKDTKDLDPLIIYRSVLMQNLGMLDSSLIENRMGHAIIEASIDVIVSSLDLSNFEEGQFKDWNTTYGSVSAYCSSKEVSFLDFDLCQKSNSLSIKDQAWMRPILRDILKNSEKALSLKERAQYSQKLANYLKQLASKKIDANTDGKAVLREFLSLMQDQPLLQKQIERGLNIAKWNSNDEITYENFIYLNAKDVSSVLVANPNLSLLNVVIQTGDWLWLPKHLAPLQSDNKYKIQNTIVNFCKDLSEKEINEWISKAENILLVQECDNKKLLNFESYFRKGIGNFASSNPQVKFIKLHGPSYKLYLTKNKINLIDLVLKQKWSHPIFSKIGWQAPTEIKESQYYETNSSIDAIQAFRVE
jgi:hypothetical protein